MFEFLIALFGGAYYGGKLLDERNRKREGKVRQAIYDEIEAKTRYPMGKIIPPKTWEEFWIMCESISDDLKFIFGKEWRTMLNYTFIPNKDVSSYCIGHYDRDLFVHPMQIAYEVWVSNKGYISRRKYNYSVIATDPNKTTNDEDKSIALRSCQMIEKNVQFAHPDLPLRLWTDVDRPYLLRWEHFTKSVDGALGERLW